MPSSLTEIANTFNIPIKVLARMKADGYLGNEVADDEIAWFVLLSRVWGNPVYVKMEVENMSSEEKADIIKTATPTRLETFILKRYTQVKKGTKINVDDLAIEIRQKFGMAINDKLKSKIKEIRLIAKKIKRGEAYEFSKTMQGKN